LGVWAEGAAIGVAAMGGASGLYGLGLTSTSRGTLEVKTAKVINQKHLRGLIALREEGICSSYILVCHEDRPRSEDGIEILPWKIFLGSFGPADVPK
jgi:hypothetical protein